MRFVLLAVACLLAACAGPREEPASPSPDPDAAAPSRVLPPEVPDADPPPLRPERFENPTEEEMRARDDRERVGTAVIRAVDAGTGEPIADAWYYGVRYAFAREQVDARPTTEVDWMGVEKAPDGVRRIELAEGWWRLRFEAARYRHTWTPRFRVERGKETALTLRMLLANRLRVRVLEPDGSPCADGAILVETTDRRGAIPIENGVAETLVDGDELELRVDPRFLDGARPWSRRVELSYGETTEVTVRLVRP